MPNGKFNNGGYVLGPGSKHASGVTYRADNDFEPASAPPWLTDALTADKGDPFVIVNDRFELPERILS